MSHRLELLLCSFGKLGQIQAALDEKTFKLITFLQTQFHTMRHKMVKLTSVLTYFLSIKRMHRRKDKTVIILSITS